MYCFWHCSKLGFSNAADATVGIVGLGWPAVLSPKLLVANLSNTMCHLAFSTAVPAAQISKTWEAIWSPYVVTSWYVWGTSEMCCDVSADVLKVILPFEASLIWFSSDCELSLIAEQRFCLHVMAAWVVVLVGQQQVEDQVQEVE